jgi:origin recognition complex subunit 4
MGKNVTPQVPPSKRSRAASTPDDELATSSSKKRRKLSHSATTAPIPKAAPADAYDVPDSDEDRSGPAPLKMANGNGSRHGHDAPPSDSEAAEEPASPTFGKTGRSNGLTVPKTRAPKVAVQSIEDGARMANGTSESNGSIRSSGRRRIPTTKAIEGHDLMKKSRLDSSASRSRSTSAAVGTPHTARFQDKAATPLKGILTPSRRDGDGDRRRKSVAFGGVEGTKTPGKLFADIPKASAKNKRKLDPEGGSAEKAKTLRTKTLEQIARDIPKDIPAVTVDEEEEPEEEADEIDQLALPEEHLAKEETDQKEEEETEEAVCSVCLKPSSRKGNEILYCDGCDVAVHQRCGGVAHIPDGDWYCAKCTSEREARATATAQVPNFERHLRRMQRVLLDRCTGQRRIKLVGQDEAYEKAHQLVEQTVLAGEGNSMLVIGARGSGKTTVSGKMPGVWVIYACTDTSQLVETILTNLAKEHRQIFHTVRLNGFIHTDDKLALKEIWRQLGKEMEVDEEVTAKVSLLRPSHMRRMTAD